MLRVVFAAVPGVPGGSSLHALTVGAVGSLTLGMMARVSLGHTGRLLAKAPPPSTNAKSAGAFEPLTALLRRSEVSGWHRCHLVMVSNQSLALIVRTEVLHDLSAKFQTDDRFESEICGVR